MDKIITVKMNPDEWRKIKAAAALKGLKIGEYLVYLRGLDK